MLRVRNYEVIPKRELSNIETLKALQARINHIFNKIQENPSETGFDDAFIKYAETWASELEKAERMATTTKRGCVTRVYTKQEQEKTSRPIFRAADRRSIKKSPVQEVVKEIRDSVGNTEKLDAIAARIGKLRLGTELEDELIGVVSRAKLARGGRTTESVSKILHKESVDQFEKIRERGREAAVKLRNIRAAQVAESQEEQRLSEQVKDLSAKLDELNKRRAEFLSKAKLFNPATGQIRILDGYEMSNMVGWDPFSPESFIRPKTDLKELTKAAGFDTVQAFVRAGFTETQAEKMVRESLEKDKQPQFKKITIVPQDSEDAEVQAIEDAERIAEDKKEAPVAKPKGTPPFRRANAGADGDKPRSTKYLKEVEAQFDKAIETFEKKFGYPVLRPDCRKGKRASGNLVTQESRISDTEVMAAMLIPDTIKIPDGGKLTNERIGCPSRQDVDERPVVKPQPQEPEKKVEKKPAPGLFTRTKIFVAKKLISTAISVANKLYKD
jgi:hypothetical protein